MKKFLSLIFLLMMVVLLCSCTEKHSSTATSSTLDKDGVDGCYTSSCTMSEVYDKDYDPDIIGTFSVEDYKEHIQSQAEILQKAESGLDNEILSVFNKNYGNLDSANFVKYVAIEVFDRTNCGQFAPDEIKVYRDEKAKCWMVQNINLERLKMEQHHVIELDWGRTVIFDDSGKLLGCWVL